jgi:hypothetical protein
MGLWLYSKQTKLRKSKESISVHSIKRIQKESRKVESSVIYLGNTTPHTPLNGTSDSKDTLRKVIATTWREIRHPTKVQLVLMILTAADVHGWNELILWKKDLKGAFNLLNYNPAFCKLFAFPLSDDVTMIHMAGIFGWIGMPHAF